MTTSESLYVEYNIYSVKLHEKHPPSLFAVVTWTSCSLSRSSVTPSDLIPLTRQAACTSFTFRLATPSSAMSWINTVHTKHLLPTTSRFNSQERRMKERKQAATRVLSFTLSSARMALSFMMSWKRRKLLVPMDCSSRRRQRATSWGRVRLSRVSSSSNSLENFRICSLLGRSPESRICADGQVMT